VIACNANWGASATDPAAKETRETLYRAVREAIDAEAATDAGQNRKSEAPRPQS
jgi:hypothetical protein